MRYLLFFIFFSLSGFIIAQSTYKELTPQEQAVILNKGTERPFSGEYYEHSEPGIYSCKQCGQHLYKSDDKFKAHCGWPSFDSEIEGAVKRIPDRDGKRTEIICNKCKGHLGHVFINEGYTSKNTRHCVNSIALDFIPTPAKTETAIFAGGCFWGVEYLMENQKGVLSVESGYIGGEHQHPTYQMISSKTTNFAEAVQVIFDPSIIDFETLAKLFFEIHDPTQMNRQGPDVGSQYRSEVFYTNEEQNRISNSLIKILKNKGFDVKTRVSKANKFHKAEAYHQNYYQRKHATPYCHIYTKRF